MSIEDAVTHLQISLLVLEYAKADAFRSTKSSEPEITPEAPKFMLSKLDAASKAVQVAIGILEDPKFFAKLSRAA